MNSRQPVLRHSRELNNAVFRCMEKNPEERWSSIHLFDHLRETYNSRIKGRVPEDEEPIW